jgi:hypothetical protein
LSPVAIGERWVSFAAQVTAVAADEHLALPTELVVLPLEALTARRDDLVRALAEPLVTLLARKWELLELSPPSPLHGELTRLVRLLADRGIALPEPLAALAATDDAPRGRVRRLRSLYPE